MNRPVRSRSRTCRPQRSGRPIRLRRSGPPRREPRRRSPSMSPCHARCRFPVPLVALPVQRPQPAHPPRPCPSSHVDTLIPPLAHARSWRRRFPFRRAAGRYGLLSGVQCRALGARRTHGDRNNSSGSKVCRELGGRSAGAATWEPLSAAIHWAADGCLNRSSTSAGLTWGTPIMSATAWCRSWQMAQSWSASCHPCQTVETDAAPISAIARMTIQLRQPGPRRVNPSCMMAPPLSMKMSTLSADTPAVAMERGMCTVPDGACARVARYPCRRVDSDVFIHPSNSTHLS